MSDLTLLRYLIPLRMLRLILPFNGHGKGWLATRLHGAAAAETVGMGTAVADFSETAMTAAAMEEMAAIKLQAEARTF